MIYTLHQTLGTPQSFLKTGALTGPPYPEAGQIAEGSGRRCPGRVLGSWGGHPPRARRGWTTISAQLVAEFTLY